MGLLPINKRKNILMEIVMNPWNKECRINFNDRHKRKILDFYNSIVEKPNSKRYEFLKTVSLDERSKSYLKNLYEDGYGLKILARELGLTYSRFRTLYISYLGLEIRKGNDIVTDKVKKFRSQRVTGENNPWFDWCSNKPEMHKACSRGIQGYYIKNDGTKVWLRSTYEYIFAKWLDKNNIEWKIEEIQFKLSNNETYRPDFFIYKNSKLLMIIEIKGYFNNRRYKAELFKKEFTIPLIIIDNINDYCENYNMEKKEWKLLTKLNA